VLGGAFGWSKIKARGVGHISTAESWDKDPKAGNSEDRHYPTEGEKSLRSLQRKREPTSPGRVRSVEKGIG